MKSLYLPFLCIITVVVFFFSSCLEYPESYYKEKVYSFENENAPVYFVRYNDSEKSSVLCSGMPYIKEFSSYDTNDTNKNNERILSESQSAFFENRALEKYNFKDISNPSRGRGLSEKNVKKLFSFQQNQNKSRSITLNKTVSTVKATNYDINSTKKFYCSINDSIEEKKFILKAIGKYCLVWYEDDPAYYNIIAEDEKFTKIQQSFDKIYPLETELFGSCKEFEVCDNDAFISETEDKVSILVFDQKSESLYGYASAIDLYNREYIDRYNKRYNENLVTNSGIVFYLNSNGVKNSFDESVSTLAHEFQHVLCNIHNLVKNDVLPEVWWTELLSCLCEDILNDYLCESIASAPYSRLIRFKRFSNYGVTFWTEGENEDNSDVYNIELYAGYASNYAFGAYLFRNFGGVEFLKKLIGRHGKDAVSYSLSNTSNKYGYKTFDEAAKNFYKIFINTEKNSQGLSLYKDASFVWNGQNIKVPEIDLLNIPYLASDNKIYYDKKSFFGWQVKYFEDTKENFKFRLTPYGFYVSLLENYSVCSPKEIVVAFPEKNNINVFFE